MEYYYNSYLERPNCYLHVIPIPLDIATENTHNMRTWRGEKFPDLTQRSN